MAGQVLRRAANPNLPRIQVPTDGLNMSQLLTSFIDVILETSCFVHIVENWDFRPEAGEVLKSRLKLPGAVLEVPCAQERCSRSFRVILCRLSVMGAGCAKRATPHAAPESPAPVVKRMRASADQDASGTIKRRKFEKFVTPIGSWSAAHEKQVFDEADEDKDGELSAGEIERAWPGLADPQWSQEELRKFTSCFDSDGDGVISKSEWAEWHKLLDTNNDGAVSSEELAHATDIAQQKFVEDLFKCGDKNGDSVLDQSEFGLMLGNLVGDLNKLSETQLSHLFQSADANGDGNISTEEFRGLVGKLDRNGDGKLSLEELELDKDGSGMVTSSVLGALTLFGPMAAELAPASMKFACQAAMGVVMCCAKGDSLVSAAAQVATRAGTKVLISKLCRYLQAPATAQRTMPQAEGAAAAAATAGAALPVQAPEPEPAEPEPPRFCLICKRGDRGMRPSRCCDMLMCGHCIGRMIACDLSMCSRCGQQWQFEGGMTQRNLGCLAVHSIS